MPKRNTTQGKNSASGHQEAPKQSQQKKKQSSKKHRKEKNKVKSPEPKTVGKIETAIETYVGQNNIEVDAALSRKAIEEMFVCFQSWLIQRGVLYENQGSALINPFYEAMNYMAEGLVKEIGGSPSLSSRPKIIHDMIAALKPKAIPWHKTGKMSYGWREVDNGTFNFTQYAAGWATWRQTFVLGDTEVYNSPAQVSSSPGNEQFYSKLLETIDGISNLQTKMTKTVQLGDWSPLDSSVSAFAKVYPYVGSSPSEAGGYYNSAELEVDIRHPMLSHFSNYEVPDQRVSTKLTNNSGGSSVSIGLPLSDLWQFFGSYGNKVPPVFKFVDFNETVYTLVYWLIEMIKQAAATGDASWTPFVFSFQDFKILVRQALLAGIFKHQYMTQFITPVEYTTVQNNFLPFMIMGHCYGAPQFSDMFVPLLLRENLSAFKPYAKDIKGEGGSKINVATYFPVLGFYSADTDPEFTVPLPSEGGIINVPIFASASESDQTPINLIDCTQGGNNATYINVNNSYYQGVRDIWNETVKGTYGKFSMIAPIGNCTPSKGLNMLQQTRIVQSLGGIQPLEEKEMTPFQVQLHKIKSPCLNYIANTRGKEIVVKDSKGKVGKMAIPPATAASLNYERLTSQVPLRVELFQFIKYLQTPVCRINITFNQEDFLNTKMLAIITSEPSHIPNQLSLAPGVLGRCLNLAELCCQGLAREEGSVYDTVMKILNEEGQAGILTSLLGGVGKAIFPGASGVIDMISSALPF